MRLEYYYYLVQLVETGSLSKTAEKLYLSKQGLSKAMQQMGAEFRVAIFSREKEGLRLTSAGQAIYNAAKQIIDIHEKLVNEMRSVSADLSNHAPTVFSTPHVSTAYLRRALSKYYRKKHPGAAVNMIELSLRELFTAKNQPCDSIWFFSIVEPALSDYLDSFGSEYLFRELDRAPILCRVSVKSDLAQKIRITSKDLSRYSLALFINEEDVVDVLLGSDAKTKVKTFTSDYSFLCDLIANNNILVGLTDTLIERSLKFPSVVAIPLEPAVYTVYGYAVRKDVPLSPAIDGLINMVYDELQGLDRK